MGGNEEEERLEDDDDDGMVVAMGSNLVCACEFVHFVG